MMFYFIAHLNDNEREQQMEQPKPMSLFRMSSFFKKKIVCRSRRTALLHDRIANEIIP